MASKQTKPAARKPSRSTLNGGSWIRPTTRLAILLRDRFICLYCGTDLHGYDPRDITLDHVTARHDGGSNDPRNLICACKSCNCSRQDKPIRAFASATSRQWIRRNTKRQLAPYRKLAHAVLKGMISVGEVLKH